MIIDGIESEQGQKKSHVTKYYMNALKREVRQALDELDFVTVLKVTESIRTDSLYFKLIAKHHNAPWQIEIRTHPPVDRYREASIFYVYSYESLRDLRNAIKKRLIQNYNMKVLDLGFKRIPVPGEKIRRHVVLPKPKKKVPLIAPPIVALDNQSRLWLEEAYNLTKNDEDWANLSEVANVLGRRPEIKPKDFGVSKLRQLYLYCELYQIEERLENGQKQNWIKLL